MRKLFFSLAMVATLACVAAPAVADADADRNSAQKIAETIKGSGQLEDFRVGVKYQDGVAWLLGNVTDARQKATAEQLAIRCAGVEKVVNRLKITGQGNGSPENTVEHQQASNIQPTSAMQSVGMPQALPMQARQAAPRNNMPRPFASRAGGGVQPVQYCPPGGGMGGAPMGQTTMGPMPGGGQTNYENPQMPDYAWPSYAANPNYAALTYPKQYSASAWPYIGPFYPYPQVPLGWRKVTLEWDDGWWFLDFKDCKDCH
ncbi:BON domain protein [Adhaeretor mobilis]|uniref:BON domain protein n=2 Tax=Adhaeretor mobilis TaxID=1930276 RepID=A0A517MYH0_9BACT|nr:BON domain protein [Adhaeretor mobilis]